jgi:hypothetical protein
VTPVRVSWIEGTPRRPLCDVPWLGTSVVLSDGNVNFCCFSDAMVGNVNQQSFEEIWDGPVMRKIRHELVEQRFPQECQSTSCPLYRGDQFSYLLDRMDGLHSFRLKGTHDPHAEHRRLLGECAVQVEPPPAAGEGPRVRVRLKYQGKWLAADLFAGVRDPDGTLSFLPDATPYAAPFASGIELTQNAAPVELELWSGSVAPLAPGRYEFCVALFARDSNPNLLSNCYWAETLNLTLGSAEKPAAER